MIGRGRAFMLPWLLLLLLAGAGAMAPGSRAAGQTDSSSRDQPRQPQQPQRLPAAFAPAHAWFIARDLNAPDEIRLHHHASGMDGPFFRAPVVLPRMPEAIVADGATVWLIFSSAAGHELYRLRAERNAATGLYYYLPARGLELIDSLPQGKLIDITAAAGAITALLQEDDGGFTLQRRHGGKWTALDLPVLNADDSPRMLGARHDTGRLVLVVEMPDGSLAALEQLADGTWSRSPLGLAGYRLRGLHATGSAIVIEAVGRSRNIARAGPAALHWLRRGTLYDLASMPQSVPDALAIGGMGDNLILIGLREMRDDDDDDDAPQVAFTLQRLDTLTGAWSEPQEMSPQKLSDVTSLYLPLVLTALILAMMVAILWRPFSRGHPVSIPEDVTLAPLSARLLATLIDLAPGVAIALLVTRGSPGDMLHSPLWVADATASIPLMLAAVVTMLHATVFEAFTQRSIGKRILGLRVLSADGSKPRVIAVIIRNALKAAAIIMPPLLVFALVNPYRQRLGDVLARTIVVQDERGAE